MREDVRFISFFLLAVAVASLVGAATGSPAGDGDTPAGFAIYLFVGLALPQSLLARRTGSPVTLGVAAVAASGALTTAFWGVAAGTPHGEWGFGAVAVFAVLLGTLLEMIGRHGLEGFRAHDGS